MRKASRRRLHAVGVLGALLAALGMLAGGLACTVPDLDEAGKLAKGSDVRNFTALVELLEAEGLRDRVVTICGGPRVTNLMASELGYDAGFGRGTLPSEVASFIALRLAERPALSRS